MDIKKGYEVAKMPILAIIALAIVAGLVAIIPVLNVLICILGLPILIANIVLYAYIGYLLQKAGMEIVDSAIMGALASLAAGLIGLVLNVVASLLGFSVDVATGGGDAISGAVGVTAVLVASVVDIIVGMIIAAIVAVVGYLIAGAMKGGAAPPKTPPAKKMPPAK